MAKTATKIAKPHGSTVKKSLVVAQLLTLLAFVFALRFLHHTTGGTLFMFATVAPILVTIASISLIVVIVVEFRRRHSLFDFETYAPGQTIFRQGDDGDRAYFIHSGDVEVVREENGSEKVLARLTRGQYFGEMALLANQPRNATVRAATDLRVAVLGKRNFLLMLGSMPSTEKDILQTVHERALQQASK